MIFVSIRDFKLSLHIWNVFGGNVDGMLFILCERGGLWILETQMMGVYDVSGDLVDDTWCGWSFW